MTNARDPGFHLRGEMPQPHVTSINPSVLDTPRHLEYGYLEQASVYEPTAADLERLGPRIEGGAGPRSGRPSSSGRSEGFRCPRHGRVRRVGRPEEHDFEAGSNAACLLLLRCPHMSARANSMDRHRVASSGTESLWMKPGNRCKRIGSKAWPAQRSRRGPLVLRGDVIDIVGSSSRGRVTDQPDRPRPRGWPRRVRPTSVPVVGSG